MTSEPIESQVGKLLRERRFKLVLAESCTGGLAASMMTDVPGSSDYYIGGVGAYAYEAKRYVLGVDRTTLEKYGAVSREVAIEMAVGVRKAFSGPEVPIGNLIGVSITGIAGPGGGMPNKPVGLVWIGMSAPDGEWAWRYIWDGDRKQNKGKSARQALLLLKYYLLNRLPVESKQ